jgi:SAM-dependent methyltransferase
MKLMKRLPSGRSLEQVMHHYRVEKSIAERLKHSTRVERSHIFSTMYDELFRQVPDHPRLTRRQSDQLTRIACARKLAAVRSLLKKTTVFVEFAPGDCRFAFEVSKHVQHVYGVDISDQRNPDDVTPVNFTLVVYDGYRLDSLDNAIDVVFSDQLIEHFHESDTKAHFELIYRLLKAGGQYLFRTPHYLTGPHDVSKYFSYKPECFHLKEWTYAEIETLLASLGYSQFHTYWSAKGINIRVPKNYFVFCEFIFGRIPKRHVRRLTQFLLPSLCVGAVK